MQLFGLINFLIARSNRHESDNFKRRLEREQELEQELERERINLLHEYHRLQTQAWQVYFNLLGIWGIR